jgi:hypothetical protein
MDPHSISRLDPDPGVLKRAIMNKKKNAANRQIIRHKCIKIMYKMHKCIKMMV